jgi:hypothetical protein
MTGNCTESEQPVFVGGNKHLDLLLPDPQLATESPLRTPDAEKTDLNRPHRCHS